MKNIDVYLSHQESGKLLEKQDSIAFHPDVEEWEWQVIYVNPDFTYQDIWGFGGAFTEAAGYCYSKLTEENRKKLMDLYFDREKGIGYTFGRTHMNSCDFALGNYGCCDEPSETLEGFNVNRDEQYIIPMIKDALGKVAIKLLISPWSPEAWMKTNGEMNHGGKLKEEYYAAWALHYAKFIKEYQKRGIDTFFVSVQNEAKATQRWDSCLYTAEEERDFVKNYLGPTLEKEGLADVKILIWDHNREHAYDRSKVAYDDPEASKYIFGTAFHWYSGDHFEQLAMIHEKYPNKALVFTEGCVEQEHDKGLWNSAERYAHHLIGDLNHHMNAWIEWNLILDEQGGPNHVSNFCDAPLRMNTETGELIINPAYYYIGHISKFITPGSVRIATSRYDNTVETVSAKTPEGKLVTVVLNRTDKEMPFHLLYDGQIADYTLPPHSIATLVY